MSGSEPYVTESPAHHAHWLGDVAIVAGALAVFALIASTLSWCDFSLQSYRLSAPVPVLLCPGGPGNGELNEGTSVRVTAVYSGSFGEFSEVSKGDEVAGWADATDIDAATGVTTADIFGVPRVTDPAFDGADCTSVVTTTSTTVASSETTAIDTTVADTAAGTTAATTTAAGSRTSVTRTKAPTTTPAATTTATTLPTTTTTRDVEGPEVGPVRLSPPRLNEQRGAVAGGPTCDTDDAIGVVTVSVSDPSGVASVSYEARVKGLTDKGSLDEVDEVYSSTVGPFFNAFPGNDPASSAVIALIITATDKAGNVTTATGAGTLVRCVPPPTTTSSTLPNTTIP